jgi:hypothetical protein
LSTPQGQAARARRPSRSARSDQPPHALARSSKTLPRRALTCAVIPLRRDSGTPLPYSLGLFPLRRFGVTMRRCRPGSRGPRRRRVCGNLADGVRAPALLRPPPASWTVPPGAAGRVRLPRSWSAGRSGPSPPGGKCPRSRCSCALCSRPGWSASRECTAGPRPWPCLPRRCSGPYPARQAGAVRGLCPGSSAPTAAPAAAADHRSAVEDAEHTIALLVEEPQRQLSPLVHRAVMPEGSAWVTPPPTPGLGGYRTPGGPPGLVQFILGLGQQRARPAD